MSNTLSYATLAAKVAGQLANEFTNCLVVSYNRFTIALLDWEQFPEIHLWHKSKRLLVGPIYECSFYSNQCVLYVTLSPDHMPSQQIIPSYAYGRGGS